MAHIKLKTMMERLIDAVGYDATMALVKYRGGLTLYVPAVKTDKCQITQWIGTEGMEALIKHFGGETIDIPIGADISRARRAAMVRRLSMPWPAGVSVTMIALALDISEARVRQILSEHSARSAHNAQEPLL